MCPTVCIGSLGTDLRIDVSYTSLRSVHARRELVFINHTFGETVDQAFHSELQFPKLCPQGNEYVVPLANRIRNRAIALSGPGPVNWSLG